MTTRQELIKKYPELSAWHTYEVILWLGNQESLYLASRKLKKHQSLPAFWRLNKPKGAKVNVRYVDWQEVYNTIKEE